MGTPVPTTVQSQSLEGVSLLVAQSLIENTQIYRPLEEEREMLKEELRKFGANTYNFPEGTVQVTEPEVAVFKAKVLVVDQDVFEKLPTSRKALLLETGVVRWEDTFTRNAKAKVEVNLV